MKRPRQLKTHTDSIEVGCGTLYVDISDDPNYQMFFARLGKQGCCPGGFLALVSWWGTAALHAGYKMERLLAHIKDDEGNKIECPSGNDFKPSCAEGLRRVLERNYKEKLLDNTHGHSDHAGRGVAEPDESNHGEGPGVS